MNGKRQARGVCIGVNHLALDSERARQAELLQKIMQLEKDIQQSGAQKSHLPEAAAEIRDDVKNNTAALRYLETISQLENSFTVLTENVTETSVQLSSPKELKDEVHVKKLTPISPIFSQLPFFPYVLLLNQSINQSKKSIEPTNKQPINR
ncbi:unnamed protein product [Trichobilharzia regenti]|nr:unnamed protein product [Trichobilharzia regenti]